MAVKQAQHTNSAVSVVNLQVLPGPSRPAEQFNSVPSSPQAPSVAPSEAGSYESEPAAGASVLVCVMMMLLLQRGLAKLPCIAVLPCL